ncbi:MAG: RHS repeat-associated core domain-containing protein [Gemmataceae bacterium]
MPRPRSHRSRDSRRPWYRVDVWSALDRLHQYFSHLLHLRPFGPAKPFTLRGYLVELLDLQSLATPKRAATFKPELTPLELRWLMDARPPPYPVIFAGAGGGSTPAIVAYAADTGEEKFSRLVYEESFTGGVRVAAADFNRDGYPDLLVGPGPGGAPHIQVLDGKSGNPIVGPLGSFYGYEPWFNGGVNVAAADVDGDTIPDVILAAGIGGGPRVRVLSGADGHVIANFYALDPDFRGGISIAAADLNGDGKAELAIGAGEGGGPRVRVYDGATLQPLAGPLGSFFAFDENFRGGVFVGADGLAGDVDGDQVPDLAVSAGPGTASAVKVYSGSSGKTLLEFSPFGSFTGGARTALAYVDDDDRADIVVGSGPGMVGTVRVFSGLTGEQLASPLGEYEPFGSVTGGVAVAASNDPTVVTVEWISDAAEPSTTGYFRLSRDTISDPLSVNFTISGTATAGTDHWLMSGATVFMTGKSSVDIAVVPVDDALNEGTETVVITLQTSVNYTIGGSGIATVNILDDESAPSTLAVTGFNDDTGSANDGVTSDNTLTVFGTAPASSSVYLYERLTTSASLAQIGNTTATAGGLWTITYATPLADGTHEFVAMPSSTNPVSSPLTASAPYYVTVDTTVPTANVVAPTLTYDTMPLLVVQASDNVMGGLPATGTVTLDADLNNDGDFTDPGEAGYATATISNGFAAFTSYPYFTPGTTVGIQFTVADSASNTVTTTPTVIVIPTSPGTGDPGPVTPTTTTVTIGGGLDNIASIFGGAVTATVDILSVTTTECGCQPLVGNYNSNSVQPASPGVPPNKVQVNIASDNTLGQPSQVIGTLTWDGAVAGSTNFGNTGLTPGANWTFNFQPPASATGRHTYTVDLFIDYTGTANDKNKSLSSSTFVIDLTNSVFGSGWSLASLDRLVDISASGSDPAGKLRITGDSQWSFYESSAGVFLSPPGDAGVLTSTGGGYEYAYPSGSKRVFDSSGRMTSWRSADATEIVTYTYDGGGNVTTLTGIDGGVATFNYSSGRVATIVSPGNQVSTLTYSGTDLVQVIDPVGGVHTLTYGSYHNLTSQADGPESVSYGYTNGMASSITQGGGSPQTLTPVMGQGLTSGVSGYLWGTSVDPAGNTTRTQVDASGNPLLVFAADGGMTRYVRDGDGRVTSQTDPSGRTTTFTLDGSGFVTTEELPDGGLRTYTYNSSPHLLLTSTNELNETTTYTYSGSQLRTVTDPSGGVTTLTWSNGLLESVVDPLGQRVTAVYDAHRRLIQTLRGGEQTGTVQYDAFGYQAGSIDPTGQRTTVVNDALGRPVNTILPDGTRTTTVYDRGSGWTLSTTDAAGVTTSYAYDGAGRQTAVIRGFGSGSEERTTTVYDAAGRVLATVDPFGDRTTNTYDGAGRVVAVTDPLGNVSRTRYDVSGNVVESADALGRVTKYGYDREGRRVSVTDPLGNIATTVYDSAGRVVASVDPLGNRSTTVYDAAGRVSATIDPLGNRSTTVYDTAGRVLATIDPLGNRTTTVYDAAGRVWATEDAFGKRTTNTYDVAGRLVASTDPLNHTSTTVYDASGRTIASIDPLGNRSTTVYDSSGRFSASIDPLGNRSTTVYDAAGRTVASIDALGNRTTSVYDTAGRVVATIDPLGSRTTSVFDTAGRTIATVDPLGNRSTTVYDAAGRVSESIDALSQRSTTVYDAAGNAVAAVDALNRRSTTVYDALNRGIASVDALGNRTTSGYDAAGRMTEWTDALNRTTTSVYDDAGHVLATIDPLGNRATSVYDAAGNRTASIDALANRTTFVYDTLNRVSATIDPLNNRSTTTYDAAGRTLAQIDALNHRTTFNYDAAGRLTSRLDGLEKTWQTAYDNAGNAIATVDPLGNRTTTVYDDANHAIAVVNALGNRTTSVYDAAGRMIATVDPLGHRATTAYDAIGRVLTNTDALNGVTSYGYDAVGNRTSLTDPVGNRTTWVYDAANRVTTETDPLNQNSTFAYDAAGYLRSTTDRLGRRVDYAFDDAGRKSTEKWYASGGSLSQTQTWTYDAAGRMLTAQDPDGTYTLAYDAAGRVSSVQEPFSLVLTFGYDAVGNRTSVVDSKGGRATMTFDARNLQTAEELGGTGVTPIRETRTYTDAGRLDTTTRYKSSLMWTSVGSTTHAYDAAGRLTGITHKDGMMTALASYAYAYDAADRLTSETINGSQRTYTYDHTDQLTADAGTPYSYDANGNRTMSGYATGTGNRMSNDGTWTYTYDAEGNVSKKSKGAASDTWTYGYDHRNQMTTAAFAATDGGTATQRVTYVYDAIGNRIERNAWDGSTATVERFGLDGWDPAKPTPVGFEQYDTWADLDGSNALVTRRMYAPGFDEITARQSAGGAVGWYLTDHLGNVRGVTNGDGTPLTTITYDAWGQVLSNSTPASSDRYLYTGREWDTVMGLWYYRARMRGTGAWYGEDPITMDASNHYRYINNGTTGHVDPSGCAPLTLDAVTKLSVSGPNAKGVQNNGVASWVVQWKVDPNTPKVNKVGEGRGMIVQFVKITTNAWHVDVQGKARLAYSLSQMAPGAPPALSNKYANYAEAWFVDAIDKNGFVQSELTQFPVGGGVTGHDIFGLSPPQPTANGKPPLATGGSWAIEGFAVLIAVRPAEADVAKKYDLSRDVARRTGAGGLMANNFSSATCVTKPSPEWTTYWNNKLMKGSPVFSNGVYRKLVVSWDSTVSPATSVSVIEHQVPIENVFSFLSFFSTYDSKYRLDANYDTFNQFQSFSTGILGVTGLPLTK